MVKFFFACNIVPKKRLLSKYLCSLGFRVGSPPIPSLMAVHCNYCCSAHKTATQQALISNSQCQLLYILQVYNIVYCIDLTSKTKEYTVYCTYYTVYIKYYTVHNTQCTVHSTHYTVHSTQCTVHSVYSTHHKAPVTPQPHPYIWQM